MDEPARIAVFDLDETLTRRDTYLPFLFGYLLRHPRRGLHLTALPLRLLSVARRDDRLWLKEQFLLAFMGGEPRERVQVWANRFAERVLAKGMRTGTLERLRAHQRRGDRVVLASASFGVYVVPIGQRLGISEIIASGICWDQNERVAGVDGANCRSGSKLARVRDHLGLDKGAGVVAYSDSYADLPLLTWAETGVAVSPAPRLAREVAALGLQVRHW